MKKIWYSLYGKERRWLLGMMAVLLLSSMLELIGLVLVIPYVNIMLSEQKLLEYIAMLPYVEPMLNMTGDYRVDASIWFALFYILKNGALSALSLAQFTILKNIQINLLSRIYRSYMYHDYTFHLRTSSAALVRSITYDVAQFTDGVLTKAGSLFSEFILFIGVLVVLTLQSPVALAMLIVMIVPLIVVFVVIKTRLRNWGLVLQQREATVIQHLQEGLGGIKEVIIRHAQAHFEHKFHTNVLRRAYVRRNRDVVMLLPRYIIETLMMVSMAIALVWLSRGDGVEQNFATITFLAVITVRLMPMSNRILTSINNIRACAPSIDTVYENSLLTSPKHDHMNESIEEVDSTSMNSQSSFGQLEMKNISFGYTDNDLILNNISFTIESGEKIGIVGSSGAGKSTLVDLMLGLLPPVKGEILHDGGDIHNNLFNWQNMIGYVPQSIFLLDVSIEENIAFGIARENIDRKQILETIKLVKLDQWIGSLPGGVESSVGERGIRISGGQRQRIGLARALYHNPSVLILDEATSALDNKTEKEIMDDIYSIQGDKTLIMIAHRLNTIQKCDKIIVLEHGGLAGIGRFQYLLKNNKSFQEISNVSAD